MIWLVDAFPIGCRVRLSLRGQRMVAPSAPTGVVVGYSRTYHALRVRRDNRSAVVTTHPDYWDRVLEDYAPEEHW